MSTVTPVCILTHNLQIPICILTHNVETSPPGKSFLLPLYSMIKINKLQMPPFSKSGVCTSIFKLNKNRISTCRPILRMKHTQVAIVQFRSYILIRCKGSGIWNTRTYVHANTQGFRHIEHTHTHSRTLSHTHTHTYTRMYAHTHAHTHTNTTHTHTHTHTQQACH